MGYNYFVDENTPKDKMIANLNGIKIYPTIVTPESVQKLGTDSKISYSVDINYDALLAAGRSMIVADDAFIEAISANNLTTDPANGSSSDSWVFTFDMPNIGTVTAKSKSAYYYGTTNEPDNGIWWSWYTNSRGERYKSTTIHYPSPNDGSLDSVIDALDNSDGDSIVKDSLYGGNIYLSFDLTSNSPYTQKDGTTSSSIGSMMMTIRVDSSDDVASIRADLQKIKGVDITGGTGSYMSVSSSTTNRGTVDAIEYKYDYLIDIQAGADEGEKISIAYEGLSSRILGLEGKSNKNVFDATDLLNQLDVVMEKISSQRSDFGAYQNRLEHAQRNDDNIAENTQAAESLIRDTDMAQTMVELSVQQILQQAGIAMMSQANQSTQGIIALLQ